ncbi:MAG: peptidoglycan-binding protein [Clostridia bacterium]|nr:peptidoglycan-binding protein [Clostridia bacterium]
MAIGNPTIPQSIPVHRGAPDAPAQNVTVSFSDYIKNVASSEIYPTWEVAALRANIFAQISYALNRVYTEFYRSRGYPFDITSSTAYDQKFINGRNIFENIDRLVSSIFDSYIRRQGFVEPLAAKYCNGTTVTCQGLSQWGSEYQARAGNSDIQILKNYYGNNIELVTDVPIRGVQESYPGFALRRGSRGREVQIIQTMLNRISQNYPAIPKNKTVDGIFGEITEQGVIRFQQIFNLAADGVVGRATWYQLVQIYTGIARLSELSSEGVSIFYSTLTYPDAISLGDRGEKVTILQYFLSLLSDFYLTIPNVSVDGIFGPRTEESVKAAQQEFGLPQTGVVDGGSWDAIYSAVKGIFDVTFLNRTIFSTETLPYGGEPLNPGDSGRQVAALQDYLNAISLTQPDLTPVSPTGTFDAPTEAAVRAYQRIYGLPETGVVDRDTWLSITNAYKDVTSAGTTRPGQFPGETLGMGDQDEGR